VASLTVGVPTSSSGSRVGRLWRILSGAPGLSLGLSAMRASEATDGRSSSDITVDFGALSKLGADLRALSRELDGRQGLLSGDPADPDLAAALARANADWSSHRRRLQGYLDEAARAVTASLAAYESTDRAIARAAEPAVRE